MDALGLSDDIRLQADRLAAAGYLAFAPDLYSGRGIRCVVATLQASRSGQGRGLRGHRGGAPLAGARARTAPAASGSSGSAWAAALPCCPRPRYDFAAASVNYGEVPKDAAARLEGCCPVVASFGKRDPELPGPRASAWRRR